jgi:hypothetical protein
LKLYNNSERFKEEIFMKIIYISRENNKRNNQTIEIYKVEKIQRIRNKEKIRKYFVQWKRYLKDQNT